MVGVEQYATLCAERERRPARMAELCSRYGLRDEVELAALDGRWRHMLETQPELRRQFELHRARIRRWLDGSG
jgi:hypothetical protein